MFINWNRVIWDIVPSEATDQIECKGKIYQHTKYIFYTRINTLCDSIGIYTVILSLLSLVQDSLSYKSIFSGKFTCIQNRLMEWVVFNSSGENFYTIRTFLCWHVILTFCNGW